MARNHLKQILFSVYKILYIISKKIVPLRKNHRPLYPRRDFMNLSMGVLFVVAGCLGIGRVLWCWVNYFGVFTRCLGWSAVLMLVDRWVIWCLIWEMGGVLGVWFAVGCVLSCLFLLMCWMVDWLVGVGLGGVVSFVWASPRRLVEMWVCWFWRWVGVWWFPCALVVRGS
jgi:hypothetical protein